MVGYASEICEGISYINYYSLIFFNSNKGIYKGVGLHNTNNK